MATFNYTSRDYQTIRQELVSRAGRSLPEWTDRDASDFMVSLIDLWSYAADVLHFYIDRAATESFLVTATQRASVMALANLYDYTPNFLTSSTSTVYLYNNSINNMTIPTGTEFTGMVGNTSYKFYSTSPATISAASAGQVSVREGVRYVDQSVVSTAGGITSSGRISQIFTIYHKNVSPATLSVDVYEGAGQTAVTWTKVDRLVTAAAGDSVYSVYVNASGQTQIQFGNGVNGRIPPTGVAIKASYTVSSGASGNVPANSITTLNSSSFYGLTITGSAAGINGRDAESLDSIKAALPSSFITGNRAVTLSDFADLAKRSQGVAKVAVEYSGSTASGGSVSIYAVEYQPSYSTASSVTSISVSQLVRETVYNDLQPNMMLGVATLALPSSIGVTPVYIGVDVYVKDNYVARDVLAAVSSTITEKFTFDKVSFGQVLTIGDFYRDILSVAGVNYAVITDFNTTSTSSGIVANGKITIDPYKLPRNGGVSVANPGGTGVLPPT